MLLVLQAAHIPSKHSIFLGHFHMVAFSGVPLGSSAAYEIPGRDSPGAQSIQNHFGRPKEIPSGV